MSELVVEPNREPAPVAAAGRASQTAERDIPEPAWLRALVLLAVSGVVAFGLVGLALAIVGWYRTWLVFPLGVLGTMALVAIARNFVPGPRSSGRVHAVAALGVVAIACLTLWNGAHDAQHSYINRDGGSYANTGLWIAHHGDLTVPRPPAPFANEPSLSYDSFGVNLRPGNTLQFQFAHLLPVLLAEADALGGQRGLFHAPELLSGIALLAFFLLAWRVFRRPWFALSATLCFALLVPQVSFSRDTYSEIPVELMVFAALALIVGTRRLPRPGVAFVAGVLLGATQAVRVDGLGLLAGVPVILALAWIDNGRARRTSVAPFILGLVPGVVIGLLDVVTRSHDYFHAISNDVRSLVVAITGVAVVSVLAVCFRRPLRHARERLATTKIPVIAGAGVAALGFAAWLLRPTVQHVHQAGFDMSGYQRAEHVAVDATRTYYERSLQWMSWWVGPVTLAVAIGAAGVLVWALLSGRPGGRARRALVPVLVLGPTAAIYLWKASAFSDHPWVDRRFLTSALPLIVLLAFGLAAALATWSAGRRAGPVVFALAVVFAAGAIAYPLWTLRGISTMSEQRGTPTVVNDACRAMGPKPAIVVLKSPGTSLFDQWTPQTFRDFCNAEVAVMRGRPDAAALQRVAGNWRVAGRPTYVVADSPATIHSVLPDAPITTTPPVNAARLERTLTRRPTRLVVDTYQISLAPVAGPS